jgi:hypothetical protein
VGRKMLVFVGVSVEGSAGTSVVEGIGEGSTKTMILKMGYGRGLEYGAMLKSPNSAVVVKGDKVITKIAM